MKNKSTNVASHIWLTGISAAALTAAVLVLSPSLHAQDSKDAPAKVEAAPDLDDQIRAAYTKLAAGPGEWVNLTAVRPLLSGASKAEVDKTLTRMLDDPEVRLEPEPFGHRIGAEEKKAAVHIGGEDRHKLAIGQP